MPAKLASARSRFADELTRQVKQGLSAERGVYLGETAAVPV